MKNKFFLKIMSGIVLCSMTTYTIPVLGYTKDETVYAKLNSNGETYKTIVSTHIKNDDRQDSLDDLSDLLGIKNTSGEEKYTQDGNSIVWEANKNDIYYQGESTKELPIKCNIKYQLDGEEISAEDVIGKSGTVKITLQYENKEERIVNINGKNVKMYVPFVVVSGMIVNNENARNIEISNGKVIDDGTKTIIVGIALPGLQDSLGLESKDIEIPSNIGVSMEVENFESSSIISYVTPKVLDEDDLNIFDDVNELYKNVDNLKDSTRQIEDGSNELRNGTKQLSLGANELKNGVNTAYVGVDSIKKEVSQSTKNLQNSNSSTLDEKTLNSIKQQASNSAKLTDKQKEEIKQQALKGSVLSETQKNQIIQQAKAGAVLSDVQKEQITEQAKKSAILTEAQKDQIIQQAKTSAILTETQKKQISQNAENVVKAQDGFLSLTIDEQKMLISTAKNVAIQTAQTTATQTAVQTALTTSQTTATQTAVQTSLVTAQNIATETAVQTALTTAQNIATQTAVQTALSTAQTIATQTAIQTAATTANQVGSEAQKTFTKQVTMQMNALENGLEQLANGLMELNNGADSLVNGTVEVNNGANSLADGIKTFNRDGIDKICDFINGDAKDLIDRVEKLSELSRDYDNFTMLNNGNSGNVKFIMIINAVKKHEEIDDNKEDLIFDNKEYDK